MRAATLVRICVIVMFVASIGVAGTTVAMKTAGTILAQTGLTEVASVDELQPIQAEQLDRQLRSYQVRLTPAGEIEGRVNIVNPLTGIVSTAQEMTIAFLQNGQVVAETRPGLEGRFEVPLAPGVYSVVGAGPDGYIAYGMQVLPAELTVDNSADQIQPVAFQEVVGELAIDSVAVPVTDLPIVTTLARDNIPPELLSPEPSGEGVNPGPPLSPDEDDQFTNRRADVALQGHQVQIRADGRLVGRMHRINQNGEPTRIRRLNVFLIQDNQVIAQAPVDELGSFSFFDVDEGVYSFVAAGVEGLAAFTMQAVSGPDLAGVPDELTLVSANFGDEPGAGATTDSQDANYAVNSAENAAGGGAGGGAGGPGEGGPGEGAGEGGSGEGGGGGSSGAGGGGPAGGGGGGTGETGLGALFGAALGAGLGYALGEDNNDNNRQPTSPSSPTSPGT